MSKASARGGKWREIREQVLVRDNYTCGYCGNEATQVDHITPVAMGGSNELTNLIAACSRCNQLKSSRVLMRKQFINPKYLPNRRTNHQENSENKQDDEEDNN